MVPVWHKYFNSCAALLFVVDITAHDRLAEAVIELLQVLQHPDMQASRQQVLHLCLLAAAHRCAWKAALLIGMGLISLRSSQLRCVHILQPRQATWPAGQALLYEAQS